MISPRPFDDRERALDFIARAQADAATATAYLGDALPGLAAELDGLAQPWLETLRVVTEQGRLVGAGAIEWDEEAGLAWVQGPWVEASRFGELAEPLLWALAAQCPPEVTRLELCGHVQHVGMAALSDRLGWRASPASHAMVASLDVVAGWIEASGVRPATDSDLPTIAALHLAEFVDAYATPRQLLADYVTLVVAPEGRVEGYASGQLQADGQAYVDFLAIDPDARGRGLGRGLLAALAHRLVAAGQPTMVHLTVEERRAPAIALYESMGMRRDTTIRGYRGPRPT